MSVRSAHRSTNMRSAAIVGAGLSGLVAAGMLAERGLSVRLFEKARGPGGRMATRRAGGYAFDHGAQYFTVRDGAFRRRVAGWEKEGLVARWEGRFGVAHSGHVEAQTDGPDRYVGVPRMSALTRALSGGLDVRYGTRVGRVERVGRAWRLHDEEGGRLGEYDAVLLTPPPAQAVPLLTEAPALARRVEAVAMRPCWAVMAAFDAPLSLSCDGLFIHDAPLSWAARNASKPRRAPQETWVLHAAPDWSEEHLQVEADVVAASLLGTFFDSTGVAPVRAVFTQAHRWRYALAADPLDAGCLWDDALRLGVCGDWCHGSRVEGAFLSGKTAAARIAR